MVDAQTGLFKVKAELAGADGIPTGSTVKLSLVTDRTEDAMLVPVDAIYYSNGNGYVYLYADGVVKRAAVEVGIYDSENAEILGGLAMDDLVVSTWSSDLYEGATAKLKGAEGETAPGAGQDSEAAPGAGQTGEEPPAAGPAGQESPAPQGARAQ